MAKILLVIDLQKEFKDEGSKYKEIVEFCNKQRGNYDIILPTLFRNNVKENYNYVTKLNWSGCLNSSESSLGVKPKGVGCEVEHGYEVKHGYASKAIFDIADSEEDVIDIVGCDSDACVLATAFALWDAEYNFRILKDYIYTTSDDYTNEDVLKLLKRNFGKCVV